MELWVAVAVCDGHQREERRKQRWGAKGVPSPTDCCAVFSQLTKHHPPPRGPLSGASVSVPCS